MSNHDNDEHSGESAQENTRAEDAAAFDTADASAYDDAIAAAEDTPAPTTTTLATQRALVREKAQQVQVRQRRQRFVRRGILVLLVLAVIAAVTITVTSIISAAANRPQLDPAVLEGDGITVDAAGVGFRSNTAASGITGDPTASATPTAAAAPSAAATAAVAPVQIEIYIDYLSPESAQFQLANAAQLAELRRLDAVTLTYHPVATLSAKSNGTKYSLRAAAAAACVATFSPSSFYAYTYELMSQQPEADADGPSDDQLADIAIAVGSRGADSVRACIANGTYQSWVKAATERAVTGPLAGTQLKLEQTPTILVNGTPYIGALDNPAELMQAVMSAESRAAYNTPSPSSTPTPTATTEPTPTPSE